MIGGQAKPDAERIFLRLAEVEQPITSSNRDDKPVLSLDQRLDRVAVLDEFSCFKHRAGVCIVLIDELASAEIVVRFEVKIHVRPS